MIENYSTCDIYETNISKTIHVILSISTWFEDSDHLVEVSPEMPLLRHTSRNIKNQVLFISQNGCWNLSTRLHQNISKWLTQIWMLQYNDQLWWPVGVQSVPYPYIMDISISFKLPSVYIMDLRITVNESPCQCGSVKCHLRRPKTQRSVFGT